MNINWQKLAQIEELKSYFNQDEERFKQQVINYLEQWQKISAEDLDKLAFLRALEITNGCTQWAYRRQDKECLSLEQTRECMQLSMSSIKNKKIPLANGDLITFSPEIEELIDTGRDLYIEAFKRNLARKTQEFYALSTAQFLVYGKQRMDQAFSKIKENYLSYFGEFYINKGINYVRPYLQ
ncbi:hypothetical protein IQ215_13615 [Cyanobacterium stanieri LEGE 03274]|uniref:Uncharacterized protein n=1 Tax=Cyanobacterium stanieri LEGE 03274 TaxID=1828756 RepID=A0ABR9V759_9CHRO|nr:hypothetical protein [Cyanobacterium stanieri]MBE9223736.1 hypothetical protein [Cyanobacterium stanieri LEGE 03274]